MPRKFFHAPFDRRATQAGRPTKRLREKGSLEEVEREREVRRSQQEIT